MKIKKILAISLATLLSITLMACTQGNTPEDSTEPEIPTYLPQTTNADEARRIQNEIQDGMLPSSVTSANVRLYYVEDDNFIRPELVDFPIVNLDNVANYHEFIESDEIPQRIIFKTDTPVRNFRYLALEQDWEGSGGEFIVEYVVYEMDALTPDTPFVVSWWALSTVRVHRGISFVDENDVVRYFAFHQSGYDGSLFFIEFEPIV